MYTKQKAEKTSIRRNKVVEGEMLETRLKRIVTGKEPLEQAVPLIYNERKEGVVADYDIRTDRWPIAAEAGDMVARANESKREKRITDKEAKEAAKNMKNEGQNNESGSEN